MQAFVKILLLVPESKSRSGPKTGNRTFIMVINNIIYLCVCGFHEFDGCLS